jgi:hypothetical protein
MSFFWKLTLDSIKNISVILIMERNVLTNTEITKLEYNKIYFSVRQVIFNRKQVSPNEYH